MTITFLQPDGVAITAQAARQGSAAVYGGGSGRRLGGRSGFRVDTPSNILTATSTTWTLGPCSAMIDPGASTHQGMYGWASDANVTGSVTAADATNARKDIVYIQVNDSSAGDGSGAKSATPAYLAGTPSASPVAPALPARSFLVGTIDVPKVGGGSPTVTLNPARFAAAGGILPVYSQAERDALVAYAGLTVRRMDVTGHPLEEHDGAAWQRDRDYSNWITTDVNWTYGGGLIKTTVGGKTFVQLIGIMYRQSGGSFTVNVGSDVALGVYIPAGWRPTIPISSLAPVATGTVHNGEPVVMVGTDGTLKLHATVANVTVAPGAHISFNTGWYL